MENSDYDTAYHSFSQSYLGAVINSGLTYLGYEANMDAAKVLFLHAELKLSKSFHKGHAFYVPNCAP